MNNDEAYRRELLVALRHKAVGSARIGEVIAEVDSHLLDTGEDPRAAFGDPGEYATAIADAEADNTRPRPQPNVTALRGFALAAVSFTSAALGIDAVADLLGQRDPSVLHLVLALIGVVAIVILGRQMYREHLAMVDPRTGQPLRVAAPNAALLFCAAMVAAQVCIVVAM
jgi:hypothetical protein